MLGRWPSSFLTAMSAPRRSSSVANALPIQPKTTDFHQPTPDPSPQKFGVSLIKFGSFTVRIYGERGASLEQRDSEASAIGR